MAAYPHSVERVFQALHAYRPLTGFCQIDCMLADERSLHHANQQSPNRSKIISYVVVTKR